MRKVSEDEASGGRIRRRDTAAVVAASVVVLLIFSMAGSLSLGEGLIGSLTIIALAAIYHRSVSLALHPARKREAQPEVSASGHASAGESGEPVSQSMLDQLPIPVLLIGRSGRIDRVNPAAREFLGLSTDNVNLSSVLRDPQVLDAVGQALKDGRSSQVEYSVMAPVESHMRALVSPVNSPVKLPAGGMGAGAMLVLTDETSIKRADRMRADFLANASHELRTPLASLGGFIETLRGHARDDEEAREKFLAIMQDQTDRMRRLINDLLVLSRVEMDEHVAPSGAADLGDLVEDVIAFLRPQIEAKSMQVETELAAGALAVGDRDQMMEVVQNLTENAIKYSPVASRLTVSVEANVSRDAAERPPRQLGEAANRMTLAAPRPEPGARFAVFRVRDQGKGIERRNLPRLSERFYRVDGQKSGPKEGTGLGLAIVKHIVNRHRGGFTVESMPGSGSVFTAFFPTADSIANAASASAPDT